MKYKPVSPMVARERRACVATLSEWGISWQELSERLGGRPGTAQHLLNGRAAPRATVLASWPPMVAANYLARLRGERPPALVSSRRSNGRPQIPR